MTATAAPVERKALGEYRDLDLIDTSPLNPRKTFDQARLEEMRDSIKQVGIIEPLVVRPGKGERVEVVAGERRYRASKMAGLREVPVIVRFLTDPQVLELMAIENEQREDVHPLERAAGYSALMKADPKFTPDVIANRIGKSSRWVQLNLQYLTLAPTVKEAFLHRGLTSGHADLLVRLKPEDQLRALQEGCFQATLTSEDDHAGELFPGESTGKDKRETFIQTPVSVRHLADWIQRNVRLTLDPASPEMALFPDLKQTLDKPGAAGGLLALYDGYYYHAPKGEKHPPLTNGQWRDIGDKKCTFVERGVIVVGRGRGQLVHVCRAEGKCRTHWPHSMPTPAETRARSKPRVKTASEKRVEAERAAWRQQQSLWVKVRPQAVKLVTQKIAQLKPGPLAYRLIGESLYVGKKNPTLQDLLAEVVNSAKDDPEQFQDLAEPLGIDFKPLFAAAAPPSKKPAQTAAAKKPAAKAKAKKPAGKKRAAKKGRK